MIIAVALVPTASAERYGKQLCTHFAHKVEASWSPPLGWADLPGGRFTCEATADALSLRITAADEAGLAKAQEIVTSHLERFGVKEGLAPKWEGG